MTALVVDTSVVFPIIRMQPRARAISEAMLGFDLFAPDFLSIELANTLWKESRFAGLPDSTAQEMRAALPTLPISFVATTGLVESAARLAHRLPHSIHDCLYLALAIDLDCQMLTQDERFAAVVAPYPDLAARVRVLSG